MKDFFEKFTPGNWIQIGLLLFFGIGGYYKFDARITQVERLASVTVKRLDDIDKDGTQKGKEEAAKSIEIRTTAMTAAAVEKRISAVELQVNAIVPKLERIDTNVTWLAEAIRSKK